MADGQRHVVGVGLVAFIGDGALHFFAADEVGAVEDDDLEGVAEFLFCGGGFEEVAGDGLVGVEADAGVLEVDDDGVEVFELIVGGAAGLGLGSVERGDGDVGGGVDLAGDAGLVFGAEDAVLGGEEGFELEAGDGFGGFGGEEVDGAVAVGVEAGLVGEDAEAEVVVVALRGFGEGGVVGGFEDVDAGEGLSFLWRLRTNCGDSSLRSE